jgi:hypothetical protein
VVQLPMSAPTRANSGIAEARRASFIDVSAMEGRSNGAAWQQGSWPFPRHHTYNPFEVRAVRSLIDDVPLLATFATSTSHQERR